MPRTGLGRGGVGHGVRVPGVYQALLDRERDWNERDDRMAADMLREHGSSFRRDRRLTELLEAVKSVAAGTCTLGGAWTLGIARADNGCGGYGSYLGDEADYLRLVARTHSPGTRQYSPAVFMIG